MTLNPIFELAKTYIVEGLSVRLDSYETALKKEMQINIEPRVYFEPDGNKSVNTSLNVKEQPTTGGLGGLNSMF